jgi:intron-binding protein aquarius
MSTCRYLFLPIWESLNPTRLHEELDQYPQLKKLWASLQAAKTSSAASSSSAAAGGGSEDPAAEDNTKAGNKKKRGAKSKAEAPAKKQKLSETETVVRPAATTAPLVGKETSFIPKLVTTFLSKLGTYDGNAEMMIYFEIFLELLNDLLSQLPTRRFLRTLLDDMNLISKIKLSAVYKQQSEDSLLYKMVHMLDRSMNFAFHDHQGKALSADDVLDSHYSRIHRFQKIIYKNYFNEMKDIVFSSIGRLTQEATLRKYLVPMTLDEIVNIAQLLGRLSSKDVDSWKAKADNMQENREDVDEEFFEYVVRVLVDYLIPRPNEMAEINLLSLYPTEEILWKDAIMPPDRYTELQPVLALPKLNLQFLTLYDYLSRNFHLYRLETAYAIREDLVDTIKRMQPKDLGRNTVSFKGWARMALPTISLSVEDVGKPRLTSLVPSHVRGSIKVKLQ